MTRHHSCRVSPFGHPRIHARLTAPRGISQPPTSFIGSQCQGIHHAPLNTYNTKPKAKKNFEIAHQHTKKPTPPKGSEPPAARCSQPLSTNQTPHPTTKAGQQQPTPRRGATPQGVLSPVSHNRDEEIAGLLSQSPIVCLAIPSPVVSPPAQRLLCTRTTPTTGDRPSTNRLTSPNPHTMWAGSGLVVLLRKEVIQPHLPVRLPCYDFVPIADPTFDGSLPQGVRPPASGVTDFHDVTGGVYKARERIHRSVADLRLLATPTSRGRVADPDPN